MEQALDFPRALVVFDLDGTLVDSAADIAEAVNRTLHECALPSVDEAVIRGWIGDGVAALLGSALRNAGSGPAVAELMPRFMVHYEDCLLLAPCLYRGVPEALQGLHALGIAMSICTNKPQRFVGPLLQALHIDHYFGCVVGGDTLPQRKPAPEPLLHVVDHYQLQPAQCLMVGDSATDLHTAQAAGMPVVMVSYGYLRGFDPRAVPGVRVVDDLRELLPAG